MSHAILHVAPFSFPKIGGVEKHVISVAREQLKFGHRVTILTQTHEHGLASIEEVGGLTIHRIPFSAYNKKYRTWLAIWKHRALFAQHDRVFVHDVGWWVLLVMQNLQSGFVMIFHGWEGTFPVRWQAKLHRWLVAQLAWRTIHIGGFIQYFYWDQPDRVLYGGVESSTKQPVARKSSVQKVRVVFLGRLEQDTAVDEYCALAAKLRERGVNYELTWVGEGSMRKQCAQYGAVTGFTTDVDRYLSTADIVWASSYLSILQAQAHGKVVIGLYTNSLKETYLKTFPGARMMLISDDAAETAVELQNLIGDQKRWSKLELMAWQYARTQSWAAVAKQYETIWES